VQPVLVLAVLADNAEYFRFAEVWSYAYGDSPQSGKPPHWWGRAVTLAG
jgi:hypothetical protein